ncbi:MAG: hypothetical protein P4L95_14305 [Rouxiella aceris]|uniref:dermonecrotic toxin domain-containing protein n=1 Tax=Rouxiella aceris TaxID=2703884 RepID=UPI00283CA501|nr:DUF6543 domain-containing protein [Rouxiella aceris]MDR3433055.1 hypothetical protein [Rouxiella aceris]
MSTISPPVVPPGLPLALADQQSEPVIAMATGESQVHHDSKSFANLAKNETTLFVNTLKNVAAKTPKLRALAKASLQEKIKNITGQDVDPDKLWLHTFQGGQSSTASFTGWEHSNQPPNSSVTLTDMVLKNFSAKAQRLLPGGLNALAGIYRQGPGAKYYGASNEFPLTPEQLKTIIWEMDFQNTLKNKLEDFWGQYSLDIRALAKAQFVLAARQARITGTLSEEDYHTVMTGAAPGISKTDPLKFSNLFRQEKQTAHIKVMRFNVNSHDSTDILYFQINKRIILYIPGEQGAFYVFENNNELNEWINRQGAVEKTRSQLAGNFALQDRQNGILTGVDEVLKKISDAQLTTVKYHSNPIRGDVFTQVMEAIRSRSYQDAATQITSNNEVLRNIWLNDIRAFNTIISPLLMLVPGGAVALASLGAVTELALDINKVMAADSSQERRQGVMDSAFFVYNTLLFHSLSYASTHLAEQPGLFAKTAGSSGILAPQYKESPRVETPIAEFTSEVVGAEQAFTKLDRVINIVKDSRNSASHYIETLRQQLSHEAAGSKGYKEISDEIAIEQDILQQIESAGSELEKERQELFLTQEGYEQTPLTLPVDGQHKHIVYAKKAQGSDNLYELFYWDDSRKSLLPCGSAVKSARTGWIKVGLEGGGSVQSKNNRPQPEEIEMKEMRTAINDSHQLKIATDRLEENLQARQQMKPLTAEKGMPQANANKNEIFELQLSTTEPVRYIKKNSHSGEETVIDGPYMFVVRADEPDTIRLAPFTGDIGHTSLTNIGKKPTSLAPGKYNAVETSKPESMPLGYEPIEVYYAGEIHFKNGELESWNNASGHYKPAKELSRSNLTPWLQRLLPQSKFIDYKSMPIK